MAEFNLNCPHCGVEVIAETDWIGLDVECPTCKKVFTITGQEQQSSQTILTPIESRQNYEPILEPTQQKESEETFVCICPACGEEEYLSISLKGQAHECSKCCEHFIAEEAPEKTCPYCGAMVKYRASTCSECKKNLLLFEIKEKFKNTLTSLMNFLHKKIQAVKNILRPKETFISICPECNTEIELPVSQKDKEYECIGCREKFIAKEALTRKCPYCGDMIKSRATICKFCKKKISMPQKNLKSFFSAIFSIFFMWKKMIGICLIIATIFVLIFYFHGKKETTFSQSYNTDSQSRNVDVQIVGVSKLAFGINEYICYFKVNGVVKKEIPYNMDFYKNKETISLYGLDKDDEVSVNIIANDLAYGLRSDSVIVGKKQKIELTVQSYRR